MEGGDNYDSRGRGGYKSRGGDRGGGYRGGGYRGGGGFRGGRGGGRGGYGGGMRGNQPYRSNDFNETDMISVKIRGLPYSTSYEEISDFFKDFHYVERSVVLGLGHDGRKNGFAAILFEDPKEAKDASVEMQGQYVGTRYVDLSLITYGDYLRFNGPPTYGGTPGSFIKLSKYVNQDNKQRSLVMRGLPYKVEPEDIIKFFEGFGNITPGDIFIEENNGRRTGSALVIFENQDVAQDAKAAQNKKNIGQEQRYVELHDCNDTFMKKVCQLFDDEEPVEKKAPEVKETPAKE